MTKSTLIDLPVSNQTPVADVPTTPHYSPIDAESNGTSLAPVAQLVALANSDATPTSTPYSTAMPIIQLIDLPLSNQTSSRDVPTTPSYSSVDAESNGTSLVAVRPTVALADSVAPSISTP